MRQKYSRKYQGLLAGLLVLTLAVGSVCMPVRAEEESPEGGESRQMSVSDASLAEFDDAVPITEDSVAGSDDSVTGSEETAATTDVYVTVSGNSVSENDISVTNEIRTTELEEGGLSVMSSSYTQYWDDPNYSNLIVFVDFSDTTHEHSSSYYTSYCTSVDSTLNYFNGSDAKPRGMRQYLYNISYGQLRVENIMPQYDEAAAEITRYVLPKDASYYAGNRNALVEDVVDALNASGQMGSSMQLSLHSGGNVLDNLAIVVPCDSGNQTKKFSAQKAEYSGDAKVGGKLVRSYNILTEGDIYYGQRGSGQIIHEFLHTVGYPDLYCDNDGVPVGKWDIMAADTYAVQYPLAYLRSSYTGWFQMDTVTESKQGVSLYAASAATSATKDRQALILKTDYSDSEFFVVEYRKKSEQYTNGVYNEGYDYNIPGSGLIIYRVNTVYQSNHDGKPKWMIYVFREGDTWNSDKNCENAPGDLTKSYLSSESGRTGYGSSDFSKGVADGAITYADGTNSGIVISNVGSAASDTITFDISFTPRSEEGWKIAAERTDAAQNTIAETSCMGADGSLYFILQDGTYANNTVSLYQYKDNAITKLGSAASGSNHKLLMDNGKLYLAYLNSAYHAALDVWNGSTWTNLYQGTASSNYKLGLAADERGVCLAYDGDSNNIYAVRYTGTGVENLGTVCSSGYPANASAAVGNGRTAVMYKESNTLYVKLYDSGANTWKSLGTGIAAGGGVLGMQGDRLYLASYGSTAQNNVYVCDLSASSPAFEKLGSNAYADVSVSDIDLTFADGVPYLAYMAASGNYGVGAKYLKDGAWSSLGSDVASSSSGFGDVGISFYNNDICVTYLSGSAGKLLVKTHAAARIDSTGNDNNGNNNGGTGNDNGGTGNNDGGSNNNNGGTGNNNSGGSNDSGGSNNGDGTVQPPATPTTPSMPSDSDEPTVEGKAYWYTKDGVVYCYINDKTLQKGWKTVNKRRYYFDKKTGAMQTGFCTLSKKTYYLGQDGVLCTGVFQAEDGGSCYADKKGVLKIGWQKIGNSWRYFDTTSWKEDAAASVGADYFATATENGEKNTYYIVKGKSLAKGWKKIDGSRYYFDKTGVMQTGKIKIGRAYYLLDADGRAHTGFVQEDGHTYYYDKNGKMATGKKTIDKQKYVFGKDGVLQGT